MQVPPISRRLPTGPYHHPPARCIQVPPPAALYIRFRDCLSELYPLGSLGEIIHRNLQQRVKIQSFHASS
jgi:hypothetical protein